MKFESLSPDNLTAIFLSLGILLLAAFVFSKIFTFLTAPKVIGEITGGFILGASGLYIIAPEFITHIFLNFQEQGKIFKYFLSIRPYIFNV
ncbi:hypothetical protein [Campylobacter armoricus]|uniref:hypothetical protein n=1 Tax=Campylobacter armoricus TaxID=2505970 RepID=UPI00191C1167|nr:hypothetical protein [Campylobacter armoricus]